MKFKLIKLNLKNINYFYFKYFYKFYIFLMGIDKLIFIIKNIFKINI